jgi:hypothetical protein
MPDAGSTGETGGNGGALGDAAGDVAAPGACAAGRCATGGGDSTARGWDGKALGAGSGTAATGSGCWTTGGGGMILRTPRMRSPVGVVPSGRGGRGSAGAATVAAGPAPALLPFGRVAATWARTRSSDAIDRLLLWLLTVIFKTPSTSMTSLALRPSSLASS